MTSQAVQGTWIHMDGYWQFRGRWIRKLDYQGPVHRNPGLSQILSMVFCLRACNLSLQNTVEPLLQDMVMIT